MTDHPVRLFADDAAVRRIGEGLIHCRLVRADWTHEAHLAACAWILLERPDIVPARDLPAIIRRFNESVGGVNDADQGYHETITQVSIIGVAAALGRSAGTLAGSLADRVNAVLRAPEGRRDWPLHFYSAERLFSREARREFVAPDLAPLPNRDRSEN